MNGFHRAAGLVRGAGILLLLAAGVPRAAVMAQAGPARTGIAGITGAAIARHIGVLADDSLLGRATPSHGLDAAAAYVAAEFGRAGLRPLPGADFVVSVAADP